MKPKNTTKKTLLSPELAAKLDRLDVHLAVGVAVRVAGRARAGSAGVGSYEDPASTSA